MVLRPASVAVLARMARTIAGCAPLALIAAPALAAPPTSLDVTADAPLTFGTIVTSGGGSRTVGADGSTSDNGVFALGSSVSAPAQFSMTFERPPGDRSVYQLVFLFSLPAPSKLSVGGVQGSLSAFTTDLPGIAQLQPGQVASYIVPNCASTTCAVTFHVGATLTVTPATSRTNLTFPLVLQCTVLAVLA